MAGTFEGLALKPLTDQAVQCLLGLFGLLKWHSSLQQSHRWHAQYFYRHIFNLGTGGFLYLKSALHLRGPQITLLDKLPRVSWWVPVCLLPYLHVVLQLVLNNWILSCEPSPAPAPTLLRHPIALSRHLSATRAFPGIIFAPDYNPAWFGGYERYKDHCRRGRMDKDSLAMPLALRAKEEASRHLIY